MRNHYIPKFYIKQWAREDGMVMRYADRGDGALSAKAVFPKAVGYQIDLYRMPGDFDDEPHRLEINFFSNLDNAAALALDVLNRDDDAPLPADALDVWCNFIMSLLHRSPAYLAGFIRAGRQRLREILPNIGDRYDELRGPDDPPTLEEYIDLMEGTQADWRTMSVLPEIIFNANTLRATRSLTWFRATLPDECPDLLLSDDPLVRTNGIATSDGHLATPLSPRRLLIGTNGTDLATRFQATSITRLVAATNKWAVEGARHFVVARDLRQDRFIRNRFGRDLRRPLLDDT